MLASSQMSTSDYPWQATLPSVLRNLKDEIALATNTSGLQYLPVEKKFTTEALVTLCVILSFVILAVIRCAIGVYESCKAIGNETHALTIEGKEKEKVSVSNLRRFLDCFCIKNNARRIFNTVSNEDHLFCLHGIRSIVLIWVLLAHLSSYYFASVKTSEKVESFLFLKATYILKNAIFIVDAFLVLSGFLNGYFFSQFYEKRNGKIPWLLFYVHRFIRISPLYFIVLGFYATLFPYLGSGPVWPTYEVNPVCKDSYIWNVLFINNFISQKIMCLTTSWYLGCEMQLYVISPIFLVLLIRRSKIGYALIALSICLSSYINYSFTIEYELIDGVGRLAEYYSTDLHFFLDRFWFYFDVLYSRPYSRIGIYAIGIGLGCYLYGRRTITNEKMSQLKLTLGWIMAAILFWISIFALLGRKESIWENAVYNGLKHVLFASGLSWVIFVCVTGQGGFINRFLSRKIFIVISRISYAAYLIHIIMFEGYCLSLKELLDHSYLKFVIHLLMVLFIFLAAFVVSLIIEAPIIRITALIFSENKKEIKYSKQE